MRGKSVIICHSHRNLHGQVLSACYKCTRIVTVKLLTSLFPTKSVKYLWPVDMIGKESTWIETDCYEHRQRGYFNAGCRIFELLQENIKIKVFVFCHWNSL